MNPPRTYLRAREGAVDEALGEIDAAPLVEILGERMQEPLERAVPAPVLEAPVARLVGRIPLGEIPPRGTRP